MALVLLQASLANHVRVNVVVQLSPVLLSLGCSVAPLQLSEVVGGVKLLGLNAAGQPSTVVLAPCPPIAGGVASCTVMLWLTVWLVLLHASLAYQVRVNVVVQLSPVLLSLGCRVAPLQLSLVVGGVKLLGLKLAGQPSTVVLSPCPPIAGGVASCTVML